MLMDYHHRWGYVFLAFDSFITFDERIYLAREAIEMKLNGISTRDIKRDGYEGKLYEKGGYQTLGTFSGQCFEAELETDRGKSNLSFLVTEHIRATLN